MTQLTKNQRILTACIFAGMLFFSLFHLTESPPFTYDEGWAVQIASNIAEQGIDGTQFAPGVIEHVPVVAVGYPLLYVLAGFFKVFGVGVLQARVMMVLYMIGFAILSFVLVRRLFGNKAAISALALLVTFPPFYAFGKSIMGEVPVLFWLTASLVCFTVALRASLVHRRTWLIVAGVAAGICMVTKTMALSLVLPLAVGAWIALRHRSICWKEVGIVAISTLVPVLVWVVVNFHEPGAFTQIGEFYSNPSAITDQTAAFMISLKFLFTTTGSLFGLGLLVLWLLGVVLRMVQRIRISMEESIGLTFALIVLASFMIHYADARYLFPLQILAILFMPYSLGVLIDRCAKYTSFTRTYVYSSIVVILALGNVYQLSRASYVADWYSSTLTHDMQTYLSTIPRASKVFFYNTPNAVPFFGGTEYYQRMVIFEKWKFGSDFASRIGAQVPDVLVISSRSSEDEKLSLAGYSEVAVFNEIHIYTKNRL